MSHFSIVLDRVVTKARVTKQIRQYADSVGIRIIRAKAGDYQKIGIHLLEAEQFELTDALEQAVNQCFPAIYLHTFKTWRASRAAKRPALKLAVPNA